MDILKILCDMSPFPNELPITQKSSIMFTVIQYGLGVVGLMLVAFAIYGIIAGIVDLVGKKNEKKNTILLVAGALSLVVGLPVVFALYAIFFTLKNNF